MVIPYPNLSLELVVLSLSNSESLTLLAHVNSNVDQGFAYMTEKLHLVWEG